MYKFEKVSEDEYKLITDKKEYTINRNIDLVKEMQSVDLYSTMIVADFLAERGETYENTKLRVTRHEGNKTIIDESNLKKLENTARNQAYYEVLNKIFNKTCGMGYIDILKECEITKNEDIENFVSEFTNIITKGNDDTPRGENT